MERNITIVSAFFDIGRGKIADSALTRSNMDYLSYFEFWARIRNKTIIYTEPKFVNEITKIRAKYGLQKQTIVIPVEDVYSIEQDLYEKMKKISQRKEFSNYRYYTDAMSNLANYDYIMLMKYWCIMDAEQRGYITDMAAWVDFGFNHGGDCYVKPEEFDFSWEYPFEEKIQYFALKDPEKELGIRNLQLQTDCIMGCLLLVPKKYCKQFWNMIVDAMKSLLILDCIDDDQQLLLMAYRMKPEIFEVHISDWFMGIKECGGEHLTTKEKNIPNPGVINQVKKKICKLLWRTPPRRFAKRILEQTEEFYK